MKKFLAILLCVCMVVAIVACNKTPDAETPTTEAPTEAPTQAPDNTPDEPTEVEYKLGMGVVVSLDSSKTGTAQVDATVATIVTDADGKIVACRIDVAQNKMAVAEGAVDKAATFKTKMELGVDYGMSTSQWSSDNDGDGRILEWDVQTKAFEAYVVGKTVDQVKNMELKEAEGHKIAVDEALLSAGCTIQITDFIDAIVKAGNDEQGVNFKTAEEFTLGVAAKSFVDSATKAATAEADGTVAMYTDFAATVVVDGKIVAALNDAIQPKIAINAAGEITGKTFVATKRELKEDYGMSTSQWSSDNDEDGRILEWYVQSAEFSKYVVGKTAAEVKALELKEAAGHMISTDEALLSAGCTIQINAIMEVVAQAVTNAR